MALSTKELILRSFNRAVAYNVKNINLAPVKQIKVTFDPFGKNAKPARQFAFAVAAGKRKATNPDCSVKIDVKSDRTNPVMEVAFNNGNKALFKIENLTYLDVLQQFNKLCIKNKEEDKV